MDEKVAARAVPDEMLVQQAKSDSDLPLYLLITRYTPLVVQRAKRLRGMGPEQEDLMQEGMLGFLAAIRSFRPDSGSSFKTYAATCVTNRMLSAVRAYHRNKNHSINYHGPLEEAEEQIAGEDPQELFIRLEEEQHRKRQIESLLSAFEQEVLARYLAGSSYQETAVALGCSPKAVDNALQRVRKKLHGI